MALTYFDRPVDTGIVVEALQRDRAVVVSEATQLSLVDTIRGELRPALDASQQSAPITYSYVELKYAWLNLCTIRKVR